jgi:hypothetical protein
MFHFVVTNLFKAIANSFLAGGKSFQTEPLEINGNATPKRT